MSVPESTQPVEDDGSQLISQCDAENVWAMLTLCTEKLAIKQCIKLAQPRFVVGRQKDCDFSFQEDSGFNKTTLAISRIHFVIERKEICSGIFAAYITDCSLNGTFINEENIGKDQTRILCHKDIISVTKPSCKLWMFHDLENDNYPKISKEIVINYLPLKIIGQGGYGEVFFVVNKVTSDKFAMKRISIKQDAVKKTNLFSEATILRDVTHENIIKFHDMMFVRDDLFIFMEYMSGSDLNRLLHENSRLNEEVVKHIFFQVALAIEYLHREKKIIHRDIKPGNILLSSMTDEYPTVKVTDFGLSKIMEGEVTYVKTLCGTPCFKPPELVSLKYPGIYDARADVWSLGVLLFLCLCGKFPFSKNNSSIPLEKQILEAKFKFEPVDIWNKISENPKRIIRKSLQKEYYQRITSSEILVDQWFYKDVKFQQRLGLSKENFSSYFDIFYQIQRNNASLSKRNAIRDLQPNWCKKFKKC